MGRGLEGRERLAAADGVPDVAVAIVLLDALRVEDQGRAEGGVIVVNSGGHAWGGDLLWNSRAGEGRRI